MADDKKVIELRIKFDQQDDPEIYAFFEKIPLRTRSWELKRQIRDLANRRLLFSPESFKVETE